MNRVVLGNEAISASAGSGKTFQLAHRYIRLLALDVPPERVLALTFSRKAAGEIFDAIIEHLCNAIVDADRRAMTCENIALERGADEFREYLRRLLVNMHRLNIGTLDSFIVRILKLFPMEFGISGNLQLMDSEGGDALDLRREVFGRIFNPQSASNDDRRSFIEAFEQSTFGSDQKGVLSSLFQLVRDWHELYLMNADPAAWGGAPRIWPHGSAWLTREFDIESAAVKLLAWIARQGSPADLSKYLTEFIEEADGSDFYLIDGNHKKRIEYILDGRVDIRALLNGPTDIKIGRSTYLLDGDGREGLLELCGHIIQTNLLVRLQQTAGIYQVIDQYEREYRAITERTGRLSFLDAQLLLSIGSPRARGGRLATGRGEADRDRIRIDYRLDGAIDHWLLDEFQDTSDLQLGCIKSLIDEVVMSADGRRSLFYVGDVKQAIYSWRGGNPDLFGSMLKAYSGRIDERPLARSYRSCPEVIEAVNRVFGDLRCDPLPPETVEKWKSIWQEHDTARTDLDGTVQIIEPLAENCGDNRITDKRRARHAAVAALIDGIDPVARGLSTAVLVRTNKDARDIVDLLRNRCPALPIVHEGPAAVVDEPAARLLLALLRYAAHPYDSLSRGHILMSPLGKILRERLDAEDFASELLARIQREGMHRFLRGWIGVLEEQGALSLYERSRLEGLEHAAVEFDAVNPPDPDRFIHFAEHYTHRQSTDPTAVRVMTIHQSKGLGFDIVVLPELEGDSIEKVKRIQYLLGDAGESSRPDWVLRATNRKIIAADERLASAADRADAAQAFDNLCLLYVAITRAKRAVYMVATPPGKSAKSYTFAGMARAGLGFDGENLTRVESDSGLDSFDRFLFAGSPDWYEQSKSGVAECPEPKEPIRIPENFSAGESRRFRPIQIRPSAERSQDELDLGKRFEMDNSESLRFGSAIHELFSEMDWIDNAAPEELAESWSARAVWPESTKRKVADQFLANMGDPDVRAIFERPQEDCELWIEKSFEAIRGKDWISGVFDRVAVKRDPRGVAVGAELLDYKSNRISDERSLALATESYRPQMEEYRRVIADLLSLSEESISARLLFTVPSRIVDL